MKQFEKQLSQALEVWNGKRHQATVAKFFSNFKFYMSTENHWRGIKSYDLKDINDLTTYVRWCIKTGNASSTIRAKVSALKQAYKFHGLPEPAVPIIRNDARHKAPSWYLRTDRLFSLLGDITHQRGHDEPFRTMVVLCAFQGLRIEEALRLKWGHVDFKDIRIFIPGTKTARAAGTFPLYSTPHGHLQCIHSDEKEAHDFNVLAYPNGDKYTQKDLKNDWDHFVRKPNDAMDAPSCTPKSLRRSFAAMAIANGMPIELLQQVMRHKDIATTQEYLRLMGNPLLEQTRRYMN